MSLPDTQYPKINTCAEIQRCCHPDRKSNQLRCGEHTDYGALTILFQDDAGGLEVRTREGHFIKATPIPGTVVVNIGDLMQRWTSDTLVSTVSRDDK